MRKSLVSMILQIPAYACRGEILRSGSELDNLPYVVVLVKV